MTRFLAASLDVSDLFNDIHGTAIWNLLAQVPSRLANVMHMLLSDRNNDHLPLDCVATPNNSIITTAG